MSTLLLHTKLYIPPARRTQVSRPHLLQRLDQILEPECKLALIAAPPGFGKSTLLSEWVAHRRINAAWLSLDNADNDAIRFWDYVIAALQRLYPHLGEEALTLLHEPQPLPIEAILATLLNAIAELPAPFVLILDDYHLIQAEPIQRAMTFLLDHLPPQMHLIIATRSDPPLPLTRLRVRNQLLEMRAADLRFTGQETATFLERMTGVRLTGEEIAGLETRTEGWAAGLQLAALALQGRGDTHEFIKNFAGDHRYLLDYLGDEVLERQPADVQYFLLYTSILDRLNAPLCEQVTGRPHAQAVLEKLERDNLFIVALDEKRQWYRYHQLFSDFLRHRLQQNAPEQTPELHRRASAWFEQNGWLLEAVSHALAAQDFAQAAKLIEQAAELLLWRRPELHTLQAWLAALPATILTTRPRLYLYHAWTLYLTNQMGAAEQRVQEAEHALAQRNSAGSPGDDALAQGMIAAIRSTLTGIHQNFTDSLPWARQALHLLPEEAISWRCMAAINLGVTCAAIGEIEEAVELLTFALEVSQEIGSAFAMLSSFWHLAALQMSQLHLRQAEETCRQLLHLIQDPDIQSFPVDGYIALLLGEIMLERNELKAAISYLLESIERINPEGFPMALLRGYVALARVKRIEQDTVGASEFLDRAEQLVATHRLQARSSPLAVYRARVWIEQGDLAAASQWVEENHLRVEDEFGYHREPHYLILARLLLAKARLDPTGKEGEEARAFLERIVCRAEKSGRTGSLVRALIFQALALSLQSQTHTAVDVLARALALAEPERCIRTFVDEGAPLAALLAQVLEAQHKGGLAEKWPLSPEYVGDLLAAFGENRKPPLPENTPLSQKKITHPLLIEALSERELEVLRLLDEGCSSNEIAERLVIAVGTARKHIKNVYGKLDAHSRLEAIKRGHEVGLL